MYTSAYTWDNGLVGHEGGNTVAETPDDAAGPGHAASKQPPDEAYGVAGRRPRIENAPKWVGAW